MFLINALLAAVLAAGPVTVIDTPVPADFNSAACTADTAQVASTQSALTAALAAVPLVQLTVDQLRQTLSDQTRARDFACRDHDGHPGYPGYPYPTPTPAPVISNDGQCVTFTTQATQYGNQLNDGRRNYNDLVRRYLALHNNNGAALTPAEIADIQRARNLDANRLGDWNRSYGQLQTVCNNPTPPVQIINEVPAPTQVAAPAPVASAPSPVYVYPRGAPNTGGGDGSVSLDGI